MTNGGHYTTYSNFSTLILPSGCWSREIRVSESASRTSTNVYPADWSNADLIENLRINPYEDINGNGQVDPWPDSIQIGGVYGDFDGVDGDCWRDSVYYDSLCDHIEDNIVYGRWTWEQLDGPYNVHERAAAQIAAARSNDIGSLGSCPFCQWAPLVGVIVEAYDVGFKLMSQSYGPPRAGSGDLEYELALDEDIGNVISQVDFACIQSAGNYREGESSLLATVPQLTDPHHPVVTCFYYLGGIMLTSRSAVIATTKESTSVFQATGITAWGRLQPLRQWLPGFTA